MGEDGIRSKEVFAKVVEDATRAFAEHGPKRKDRRRESGRWEKKGVVQDASKGWEGMRATRFKHTCEGTSRRVPRGSVRPRTSFQEPYVNLFDDMERQLYTMSREFEALDRRMEEDTRRLLEQSRRLEDNLSTRDGWKNYKTENHSEETFGQHGYRKTYTMQSVTVYGGKLPANRHVAGGAHGPPGTLALALLIAGVYSTGVYTVNKLYPWTNLHLRSRLLIAAQWPFLMLFSERFRTELKKARALKIASKNQDMAH